MNLNLTPISIAISSGILFSSTAVGQTTSPAYPNGSEGVSTFTSGAVGPLVGDSSYGKSGDMVITSPTSGNGEDGNGITGKTVTVTNAEIDGGIGANGISIINPGSPGDKNQGNIGGVGGSGGYGGASALGGVSVGGTGGVYEGTGSASGGHAGDVVSNTVTLDSVILNGGGATGGNGADTAHGTGGLGGLGGATVSGGRSVGGSGGGGWGLNSIGNANGGNGGRASENTVRITNSSRLIGGAGGNGGTSDILGPGGAGGAGGAAVFGGSSVGGNGGYNHNYIVPSMADGGSAGDTSANSVTLESVILNGSSANGGDGGRATYGTGGRGGYGGASIYGGVSVGGAGGAVGLYGALTTVGSGSGGNANGGNGGNATGNSVNLKTVVLNGTNAFGGKGGRTNVGAGGAGGRGGASVFGGVTIGGGGGYSNSDTPDSTFNQIANGGSGGAADSNRVTLDLVTLDGTGAKGGDGGISPYGSGGVGGHGGGSVFGGLSVGGGGGYGSTQSTTLTIGSVDGGGSAGASNNEMILNSVVLKGGAGGLGGTPTQGGKGADGLAGGSVYGGVSFGGAGGYFHMQGVDPAVMLNSFTANGGNAGATSNNTISVSGVSSISGDIYGGYSQGGSAGVLYHQISATQGNGQLYAGTAGEGGLARNNTVKLTGENLTITGAVYGGWSRDGGSIAPNFDTTFTSYYQGNTLELDGYKGSVAGIHHFENYDWILPLGVKNADNLINITGTVPVALDNTKHSIAMYNDGNQLNGGDQIIMINKVQGNATFTNPSSKIRQGLFLVYDATLETVGSELVLNIMAKEEKDPGRNIPDDPAGQLHPDSKSYLKGRLATLATLNQGADVIVEDCRTNVFGILNGSSSRYDTGSHIKVHDLSLVLGGSKCFELEGKSTVMLGAYVQHGNSNYDSYDNYGADGEVYGWGKVRYTGLGLLFHMNVADTGSKANGSVPVQATEIGSKDGLYLNGTISAGKAKTRFNSNMVDVGGVRGEYDSKSNYVAAMAGVGYAWKIDEKQMLDFYGRYSWTHLGSDSVMMGLDRLNLGSLHSSRVRIGGRYNYDYKPNVKPYVELAYAHEFSGKASGVAYDMPIAESSLKGGTGILEVGLNIKPSTSNPAWTVNMGLQGYVGQRKGAGAEVKVRYAF